MRLEQKNQIALRKANQIKMELLYQAKYGTYDDNLILL